MSTSLPKTNKHMAGPSRIFLPTSTLLEDAHVATESPNSTPYSSTTDAEAHSRLPSPHTLVPYPPSSQTRANKPESPSRFGSIESNVEIPYSRLSPNAVPTAPDSSAALTPRAIRPTAPPSPVVDPHRWYFLSEPMTPAYSLTRRPNSIVYRPVWVNCSRVGCWATRSAKGVQNGAWLCQKHVRELNATVEEMFLDWYTEGDSDSC